MSGATDTMAFLSSVPLQGARAAPLSAQTSRACRRMVFAAPRSHAARRAATGTPLRMSQSGQEKKDDEVPFEIRGFSLANFGTALGIVVTGYSFFSYFTSSGTASGSSLGFVYGVPILLIGLALKYAELKPVPVQSTPEAAAVFEEKATEIQKKIKKDVTRHRYGDEAHMDTALKALGLIPRGAACPELVGLSESVDGGQYKLGLEFFSKETPYALWEEKVEKCERFFGPNIKCEVSKLDEAKRLVRLDLISTL
ncbi:Thylakoid membrane protein [Porphyridium purpureum]|uniref:Thylakoid membrane protein n=1 Tax=Porphyridium purpureum TaxID=35688 RepID=A0A5J4YMU9_PORPP|nr:Thylakoid membrane protein [Porphyridium purpureum]|eukprot:POR7934..scf222_8